MNKGIKITGLVEQFLTDIHGVKRKIGENHNTISTQFYAKLAKALTSRSAWDLLHMSNFFTAGLMYPDSQVYSDGIVAGYEPGVGGAGVQFAFACTDNKTATQYIVTGVFTNSGGVTKTLGNLCLGNNWVKNQGWEALGDGGFFSSYELAYGGMADVSVPLGEVLTVVWTINFSVH